MEEKEEVSRELEPTRERRRFIRLSNRRVGTVLLPVAPGKLANGFGCAEAVFAAWFVQRGVCLRSLSL